MCTPVLTAVGTVMSASANMSATQAQANQYKSQADTARQNSLLAQQQAANAAQQGAQEEQSLHYKGKQTAGAQTAAFGASGIDSGSGSPIDILSDTSRQNTLDVLNVRRTTANQTYGLQTEAANYNTQAKNYDSAADSAKSAGTIGAIGSLLTGFTTLNAQKAKRTGVGLG